MTPDDLKKSILQLAIQGKLVPQLPEEESAEDLYKAIQKEKQALVKSGKIKKEKDLSPITEDEIPFDIPDSWKWVKLGDIVSLLSGTDLKPFEYNDKGEGTVYVTGASSLTPQGIIVNRWTPTPKNIATRGDLLLVCKGSVGKTVICDQDRIHIARQIMAIKNSGGIDIKYIQIFLSASITTIKSAEQGIIPGIDRAFVRNLLIPLPPLAEQKRIVAKIEELLPLVDQYGKAWEQLEQLNKAFPDDLKKSILQFAIQGKLVPQLPEEDSAENLYKAIQKEKQTLVKSGKIKKEKPLSEAKEDDFPFDVPNSWKWVKLGDVITLISGTDMKPSEYNDKGEGSIYVTGASSLTEKGIIINRWTSTPKNIAIRGDLLLVCKGSGYGKTVICDQDLVHIARQIMAIKYSENLDIKYIQMFLSASIKTIKSAGQGIIPGIDRTFVRNLMFPLPPLAEQHRIVAKVEELLTYCDRIKF